MGLMTEGDREGLETIAAERAAAADASDAIVLNLRDYCDDHGIDAGDSELFVIAESALAHRVSSLGGIAHQDQASLAPRGLKDRRKRERRQRPRRIAGRRRGGLSALVQEFLHPGPRERRSGSDRRRSQDRREILRRSHVRRTGER